MTKLEKDALRQVIANGKRPSVPGARVPDYNHPDHWLPGTTSPEEIDRLIHDPDFRKGWDAVQTYYLSTLELIMGMTPAQLRAFTGTDKQIKT
jgi:hypothetical protein